MDIQDFTQNCGEKNTPGIIQTMYAVSVCDIEIFPARKPFGAIGDTITLDGNIVLKAGKKWAKIAIISDSAEATNSAIGVKTSKAFSNKVDFKLQKNIYSDEWFNRHLNVEGVFLIREKVGKYRVYGTIDSPAQIVSAEGKGGTTIESERNWNCQIADATGDVFAVYEGSIKLSISDFNNDFNNDFN